MKTLFFFCMLLTSAHHSMAGISCERKFDALEELRVSSFDAAVSAPSRPTCFQIAEDFLVKAGDAPHGCADAKALIKDWSDSYQSDTHKTLSLNPTAAYTSIKQWAYQTLKTKCIHRQFN